MVFVLAVTFVCIMFIFIDLVPIYKNKDWLVFWVYTSMLAVIYTSVLLTAVGVEIPSPSVPLKKLVNMIMGGKNI
jgi:hypothetical protein